MAKKNEEKFKAVPPCDDKENLELDEDFEPMWKKRKVKPDDVQAMFPKSSMTNCTFNINRMVKAYSSMIKCLKLMKCIFHCEITSLCIIILLRLLRRED